MSQMQSSLTSLLRFLASFSSEKITFVVRLTQFMAIENLSSFSVFTRIMTANPNNFISNALPADKLTIFETKDILYHFNAGWLYNNKCDTEFRRRVDREIIGLRVDGSVSLIHSSTPIYLPHSDCSQHLYCSYTLRLTQHAFPILLPSILISSVK